MDHAAQVALYSKIAEAKGLVNSLEGNLYITPSHKAKALLDPG